MAWEKFENIKGPKGDKGAAGTVGSVSVAAVAPDAPATAKLTGTESVHLHLEIPKGAKGDRGPAGVASSAAAEGVPYGEAPQVILEQYGESVHMLLKVPAGAPGVNAVPAAEAVGGYLSEPTSPSRAGLKTGMAQVAADPASAFAVAQKEKLDSALKNALSAAATVDELIFSARFDCGYSGPNAIVEFTASSAHSVFTAPFDLEVTSVVVVFDRFSIERNETDYVRGWVGRTRNGESTEVSLIKRTSTTTGGEGISPRKPWSLTDNGLLDSLFRKGDILTVALGVTGMPDPIKYPFTVTIMYRPI